MFNRHTLIKLVGALLVLGIGIYLYNVLTDEKVENEKFADVTDLTPAFIDAEKIAEAKVKLQDAKLVPATVVTKKVDGKREIALTFDGLPRPQTMERLLDVLEKYNVSATFFAEGGAAAHDKTSVEKLFQRGHTLGSYTYVGLAKLHTMPQEKVIEELCNSKTALEVVSNNSITLFKAPKTRYDIPLLKIAKACSYESAVKSDVFLGAPELATSAQAETAVKAIKPGSIVSLVVNRPIEIIVNKEPVKERQEEDPAYDKKPSFFPSKKVAVKHSDLIEQTTNLLEACHKENVQVIKLKQMRTVRLADEPTTKETPEQKLGAKVVAFLEEQVGPFFSMRTAAAAEVQLAEEQRMILTTEQALAFTFTGFSKPAEVEAVLERMQKLGIRGTFFVGTRDLTPANDALMKKILAGGNELAIAVYTRKNGTYATVRKDIQDARALLERKYGVKTKLAKQPWGVLEDFTRQAVHDEGCILLGQNVNVVQSKHKDYVNAHNIMSEIFGKFVYSVGRGWIINFRMDFYDQKGMCADVMQLLKEQKVDNIAYWAFNDDPGLNPANDSAYAIKPAGELLRNTQYTYTVPATDIPQHLRPEYNRMHENGESFMTSLRKRYLGATTVNIDSNTIGFNIAELRALDTSGVVKTQEPVVFLSFDDWGTDAAINKLLYVLRKHNVPGMFYFITYNVKNNPNLLRAVAMEGHEVACHTNAHKPMAVYVGKERLKPTMNREEFREDLRTAYAELVKYTGDVKVNGKYSLTRFFRPPTLTISKMGMEELFNTGYEYVVSGSTSTHDYMAKDLYEMVDAIREGLYENGKVKNGAVFVMHMSDKAQYTARALDIILTLNEMKPDGDPTKFKVGRISDYMQEGYDQSVKIKKK